MKKRLAKKLKNCYVTLMFTTKEYGGPEEGGWWYNSYSPIMTVTKSRAKQAIKRWTRQHPEINSGKCYGGYSLSSCLCGGIYSIEVAGLVPKETEKPYYC